MRLLLLLLPLLLPLLPLLFLLPFSDGGGLIEQTCKLTPFPDLCLSALHSSPGSSSTDLHGLAGIMANSVLQNANQTLDQIQQLLDRSPADPETEHSLAYCAELYIPVVKYNLPQAIDALSKGRLGFAAYAINDAVNEAQECEKKLSGGSESLSQVSDRNKIVTNMAAVALAIIKVLQKGF
ncbi:cell wall / vacuolar inhibitor of fructosidase 2-like [Punica granatum]|uniref:Pectinesterase inhibitor domain-containing protein n=2 Tax=Punica granatum TaxID=22663 RepID=A0A218WF25_PUNGR|nr:cell wall / vacuolar inhibitor of fructosidase 2-like [Punica granatum]OWM71088.1 hypothetical protein CDL15_Pgr011215 [Punica granatum]PKI72826.1 hypothetical protein CRG98_006806 [Punica granatum]